MKFYKARSLNAPYIQDSDLDWWVSPVRGNLQKYELAITVEEFLEYETSLLDDDGAFTKKMIKNSYGIRSLSWNRVAVMKDIKEREGDR